MREEIVDTYDEAMHWTGRATRQEVHRRGLWHQTFHCWVLHRKPAGDFLVLQRRHAGKDTHPHLLDVSSAGHLEAGESPADGVRELAEELGLRVPYEVLAKLGVFKYSGVGPGIADNEFCHVFALVRQDADLGDYQPALGEVSGLYEVRLADMVALCQNRLERVPAVGFDVDDEGQRTSREMHLSRSGMVWFGAPYYTMLVDGIRQAT